MSDHARDSERGKGGPSYIMMLVENALTIRYEPALANEFPTGSFTIGIETHAVSGDQVCDK